MSRKVVMVRQLSVRTKSEGQPLIATSARSLRMTLREQLQLSGEEEQLLEVVDRVIREFTLGSFGFERDGGKKPAAKSPPTQEAVKAYLTRMADGGAAQGYIKVRGRKLRFFARQHPELSTDPEVIRTYLRQFRTDDVPTRQDQWKALAALYEFASASYGLPNPLLLVDKPRFKRKPGERMSRDQAREFLSAMTTPLEWAAVTCYFGLRLRRVEAERIVLRDIKPDYIIVRGKERIEELPLIPLFRDTLLALSDNKGPDDRLFPIKGDTLAYHIRKIFERAGIQGVRGSPHTLRNTAGRLWLTYGGDDRSNRQLLRHSNLTMTDHYSELSIDELYQLELRFNPMLNLLRELGLAPFTNTSSVRETFICPSTDPTHLLPELLDQMIALGQITQELKRGLGGNGHWPDEVDKILAKKGGK